MDEGKNNMVEISDVDLALREEARYLGEQLFGSRLERIDNFTNRLLNISTRARGKDFLLVHNSGGWGSAGMDHCLQWERSLVTGVSATIEKLEYTSLLIHYLRTGRGWREKIRDVKEQFQFFAFKARLMAAELRFLTQHNNSLKVLLIGVSQGAAFSNAVMRDLTDLGPVYSIELGMPFNPRSRRLVTEKALALDSNGLMPDATVQGNLAGALQAYLVGPFKWLMYQLQRRPVRFAQCINAPGHDYDWGHPEVRQQIEDFLKLNFGTKHNVEVVSHEAREIH